MMNQGPLADAHAHFFEGGYAGRYGRSPAGTGSEIEVYETLREEHGILTALAVGYEGDAFAAGNNTYLRTLAASRTWMATVAFVEASSNPTPDDISRLLDAGHRGVSLYVGNPASAAGVAAWRRETWDVLDSTQAIVSLNITPEEHARLTGLFATHPECRFLFSHLGLPGGHTSPPAPEDARRRIAALLGCSELPNCWVKISGLYATSDPPHAFPHHAASPYVAAVIERYGVGRCLWGSDFSPALDHVSFAQAATPPQLHGLDPADVVAVMGRNLTGILA